MFALKGTECSRLCSRPCPEGCSPFQLPKYRYSQCSRTLGSPSIAIHCVPAPWAPQVSLFLYLQCSSPCPGDPGQVSQDRWPKTGDPIIHVLGRRRCNWIGFPPLLTWNCSPTIVFLWSGDTTQKISKHELTKKTQRNSDDLKTS